MINILDLITYTNINMLVQFINILIIIGIIFIEHKNPQATFAWVLVLLFLPIFGLLIYGIFSQNIARLKVSHLSLNEEKLVTKSLEKQMRKINNRTFEYNLKEAKRWEELIKLNQRYDSSYFTQDNKVEILPDGNEMFEALLEDIRNAKEYINIEYFIIKYDEVGKALIEALAEKAGEGVTVRLLMDAMGSRHITDRRVKPILKAGGKVAYFFRPKLRVFMMRLNYRNHRKLTVIDDRIGYIGGFNIAREYLGKKKKFGYWRDTHARIQGSAIKDINARFLLDWRYTTHEDVDITRILTTDIPLAGETGIQIVSSGPDEEKEEVKRAFNKVIAGADKNIYIQTPYFVPDESIQESLKIAAMSGVDVRVMIPCKPDHIFVYWATLWYVADLLRAGVKVYIYKNGFLHAKTIMADGEMCSVGSANFDNRSFKLNFESNAFIYDSKVTHEMEALFEKDMELSRELTVEDYEKRGYGIKFKENISRLFTYVL